MKVELRWKVFAALGTGTFALALYALWKTALYFSSSGDKSGTIIFALVGLSLLFVTGLHWYMAAGFKFGRLDLVTGTLNAATLQQGARTVISAAKVQFVRKLDADNLSLTENDRYIFFICAYRPWVCKEDKFQVSK